MRRAGLGDTVAGHAGDQCCHVADFVVGEETGGRAWAFGTLPGVPVAQRGHRPVGVDLSPRMVEQARRKFTAAGFDAAVLMGDASDPPARAGRSFDVILVRHLLRTLPAPQGALRRWVSLLRPGGLVLIEGNWDSPADDQSYAADSEALPWLGGVTAERLLQALRPLVADLHTESLTDPDLWGRPIHDERYAIIARP
ncbi:class I SAM-dependent methyltransferase [Streptosporangium sp. NPDC006013]|uniref:class I SAM-dependent methyltransferase n=1 Tax=Streptosporangium sp. NPDC006013 TaxID=3155596 RepID=UPI0033B6877B